ncbi:chromatin structure-remodeling complex protein SYD isoform X2 [Ananas comosus]|uniref:Chromatin structure-remodeling complex protein SYD isoform X2 n=1 Tax=Ananas comosus TaxID=4615 RepID=A0A6P5F999_ANACO|nr:chromatin structure-remodeling complex protein SYD isoform X2 [Ananas comosus]
MASPQHVEMEAAKLLHKLIQESKDEPVKLATKLYVICQHMKLSGKEQSLPYQVISRAMETVVNQHGLDLDALRSSRLPLASGPQAEDPGSVRSKDKEIVDNQPPIAGSDAAPNIMATRAWQVGPVPGMTSVGRPPLGPSRMDGGGADVHQGSISQRSSKSSELESPVSVPMDDNRSANSQDRHDSAKSDDPTNKKKTSTKRKRADSKAAADVKPDTVPTGHNLRKGKQVIKGGTPGHEQPNPVQSTPSLEKLPSLSSGAGSLFRAQQEGAMTFVERNTDRIKPTNQFSVNPGPKLFEEGEVSSGNNTFELQKGSLSSRPAAYGSTYFWNQNRPTQSLQNPQGKVNVVTSGAFNSFAFAKMGFPYSPHHMSSSFESHGSQNQLPRNLDSSSASQLSEKGKDVLAVNSSIELSSAAKAVVESDIRKSGTPRFSDSNLEGKGSGIQERQSKTKVPIKADTALEQAKFADQLQNDVGTGLMPQLSTSSNMPFKEQQLKQLRAQCLVFLAFRNNLMPRKLHLEIALGESYPREERGQKGYSESRGTDTSAMEPGNSHVSRIPSSSTGSIAETDSSSKDTENTRKKSKKCPNLDNSMMGEENKETIAVKQKGFPQMGTQETAESAALPVTSQYFNSQLDVARDCDGKFNQQTTRANQGTSVVGVKAQPPKPEWTPVLKAVTHDDSSQSFASSLLHRGTYCNQTHLSGVNLSHNVNASKDDNKFVTHVGPTEKLSAASNSMISNNQADVYVRKYGLNEVRDSVMNMQYNSDAFRTLSANDIVGHGDVDQDDGYVSASDDIPTSPPKYTTCEKWIRDHEKRKLVEEQKWVSKQRKAELRIAARFEKLKENVSSSEDISAKTKSVIELKKLQLLQLQRRLRSEFLNDFFKPITPEIDRIKSSKKHRHGRRVKQIEKVEQKMKEERQKRIRERQKEFFGEVETHREKLEDCFKVKKERWKGFNRYVKEFHKRKERIHREKIDRIQREKINLLKNNDVEGYLRMVQDAKSDRVKQLLKETEKYLQKLGSKLRDAKTMARRFEMDMDESRMANFVEKNEVTNDNEDESDQAQHYLESNEKYYQLAHSVKEVINDQPSYLKGGKLREYQMNGLRWLVSLYNNHLNGILADEMGLGKTVQVISLICYLMEAKNDRGPFLVVVPSSVLSGWASELSFWAPDINKIAYAGPPEERRRLFKEMIIHQKFNVLLTTYEYLMNKHDRPKLSKIHWHYIIIDEGHRIKNASCKLNADLKHYRSFHRLLLTGTPLQNNLEELWALLNFLLPDIFNSSEDFSQWFNKPFQSGGDNSPDEGLLSEEENLLIINRLHQVLRPFVLRRLKHKVENELPEKIERLVRCEASAYQKLLMKRVEENLGSIGNTKVRSVHNTVMELRNICNHPYLSQLNAEEIDVLLPRHYLPPLVRLCGKLEMLDRLLPKLKATDHRILLFSTMTRLLDVMEEYLTWKQYKYLRLDGHTSGLERGALIEEFNRPGSQAFIFLLSIRAGGVGVNLQAADTVIIFDTDWNPQVDLQAQARAHRLGQKKDVLVLRLETVCTVEEQVRAAAEHKLGVANQSITAGFFDNNTSAEDRREYLESLLRECKKEEAASVLDDDALNDLLARSESEIDIFESIDKQRREDEMALWQKLVQGSCTDGSAPLSMPSRLVTEEDLKPFYKAMKIHEVPNTNANANVNSNTSVKRKGENLGGLDTQQYGRGKRAREVRSYEDQWTEEEFEKLCQADSPESPPRNAEVPKDVSTTKDQGGSKMSNPELISPPLKDQTAISKELTDQAAISKELKDQVAISKELKDQAAISKEPLPVQKETPPVKRGRGRPKRTVTNVPPPPPAAAPVSKQEMGPQSDNPSVSSTVSPAKNSTNVIEVSGRVQGELVAEPTAFAPLPVSTTPVQAKGRNAQTGEKPRGRGRKPKSMTAAAISQVTMVPVATVGAEPASNRSTIGAPTIPLVDPVSGLQKVDVVPVKACSSSPEKLKSILPASDIRNVGSGVPARGLTEASVGTKLAPSAEPVYILHPKMHDAATVGSLQTVPGQVLLPLMPAIPVFAQDSKGKKAHYTGTVDKPLEKHIDVSSRSTKKTTSAINTKTSMKHESTEKLLENTDHQSAESSEKQESAGKGDGIDTRSTQKLPTTTYFQSCGIKPDDASLQSAPVSVPIYDASTAASLNIVSADKATFSATETPKAIEAKESVKNHENVGHEKAADVQPGIETLGIPTTSASLGQMSSVVPVEVKVGPQSKPPVTRRKGAAREPRNRSTSATAACERRARLAVLKQSEESKKVDSTGKTAEPITVIERHVGETTKAESVPTAVICRPEERDSVPPGVPQTITLHETQVEEVALSSAQVVEHVVGEFQSSAVTEVNVNTPACVLKDAAVCNDAVKGEEDAAMVVQTECGNSTAFEMKDASSVGIAEDEVNVDQSLLVINGEKGVESNSTAAFEVKDALPSGAIEDTVKGEEHSSIVVQTECGDSMACKMKDAPSSVDSVEDEVNVDQSSVVSNAEKGVASSSTAAFEIKDAPSSVGVVEAEVKDNQSLTMTDIEKGNKLSTEFGNSMALGMNYASSSIAMVEDEVKEGQSLVVTETKKGNESTSTGLMPVTISVVATTDKINQDESTMSDKPITGDLVDSMIEIVVKNSEETSTTLVCETYTDKEVAVHNNPKVYPKDISDSARDSSLCNEAFDMGTSDPSNRLPSSSKDADEACEASIAVNAEDLASRDDALNREITVQMDMDYAGENGNDTDITSSKRQPPCDVSTESAGDGVGNKGTASDALAVEKINGGKEPSNGSSEVPSGTQLGDDTKASCDALVLQKIDGKAEPSSGTLEMPSENTIQLGDSTEASSGALVLQKIDGGAEPSSGTADMLIENTAQLGDNTGVSNALVLQKIDGGAEPSSCGTSEVPSSTLLSDNTEAPSDTLVLQKTDSGVEPSCGTLEMLSENTTQLGDNREASDAPVLQKIDSVAEPFSGTLEVPGDTTTQLGGNTEGSGTSKSSDKGRMEGPSVDSALVGAEVVTQSEGDSALP